MINVQVNLDDYGGIISAININNMHWKLLVSGSIPIYTTLHDYLNMNCCEMLSYDHSNIQTIT